MGDNRWVDQSSMIPFTLSGGAAKKAVRIGFNKGDRVSILGKLNSDEYNDTIRHEVQLSDPMSVTSVLTKAQMAKLKN